MYFDNLTFAGILTVVALVATIVAVRPRLDSNALSHTPGHGPANRRKAI